jgi:hypothetical protein
MKRMYFCMLFLISLVIACTKDTVTQHYTFYRPVYKTKDAVVAGIKNSIAQPIQKPGKLVWKDNYVFVNDVDRGIHILDISNPAQIKTVSYINIPGCVDLAVYGNFLYADCYTDLVTIDISDPLHVITKKVLPGVFPHRRYNNYFRQDTSMIITEWIRVDTVVKGNLSEAGMYDRFGSNLLWYKTADMRSLAFASSSSSGNPGIGMAGSTARFALMNNQRMYTVSHSDMKVFNVTNAASPSYVKTLALSNSNIETIFPYQDKLFIGSMTGMFIYNAQNPDQPEKLGQFIHVRTCDPVIADNNYAYVTLKGGGQCGGAANQLDVLDVSNLMAPKLIKTYPLTSPTGLSKDGYLLFICDGRDGLKIFDATHANAVSLIKQLSVNEPHDVIAQKGIAIVVAKDGFHVIDYTSPSDAKEISSIKLAASK